MVLYLQIRTLLNLLLVSPVLLQASSNLEETSFQFQHPFNKSSLEGRIIGGQEAHPGQWPFMASIQRLVPQWNRYIHWCGGAILTDQYILTAAHCVKPPMHWLRVLVGTRTLNVNLWDHLRYYRVAHMVFHNGYDQSKGGFIHGNDVALFKLDRPIAMEALGPMQVQQVCLPGPNDKPVSSKCAVMGWGIELHDVHTGQTMPKLWMETVTVSIMPLEECWQKYPYFNNKSIVCLSKNGPHGTVGGCSGDSGMTI